MALRTTIYSCLAAQALIQHDKELRHGDRELAPGGVADAFALDEEWTGGETRAVGLIELGIVR